MTDLRYGRGAAFGAALLAGLTLGFAAGEPLKLAESSTRQAHVAAERLEIVSATGTHTFDVEIATTAQQQALGLMYRTSLAADKGMLFHHGKERELTMWMKNTYIPLDMVLYPRRWHGPSNRGAHGALLRADDRAAGRT